MHGFHSNAHGPLNVRIDQVVKKGDDYNHQKVIDAWHQVCGESAEPDYRDRKYNYCKHLEHTSCHILCIKKHNVCSSACCHSLGVLSAATGGSAADSCTASLPPLVGGGGEFSGSDELKLIWML